MPGFRFCHWCHGKGCMCCDTEQARFEAAAKIRAEREAKEDPRHKLARLTDPMTRTLVEQMSGPDGVAALEAEIKAAEAACDAEYERQFPGGPKPIFTAKRSNPDDVALLRSFAGGPALNRIFADGVTAEATAEMLGLADKARLTQATRQVLCPNESDRDD